MREWVSINGRLMPAEQAQVSAFDSGFLQGVGLFETMRAYQGTVFRLAAHLQRLADSAARLGWAAAIPQERITSAVREVVNATEHSDARVRVTVTTGSLRAGEADQPELTIVVSAAAGGRYPPELYQRGAALAMSRYRQNPFDPATGHKTTSYFSRLASLREAHAAGAHEALWLTIDDEVAEGAISNVFVVQGGVLRTPPLDLPVLPGITRAAVLEVAQALGLPAVEAPLQIEDVLNADELFLTNSMMEVLPAVMLERHVLGSGKPGELTGRIREAYAALVQRECHNAAV